MRMRLVICRNGDGSSESVTFVDTDDKTAGRDFCRPKEAVAFDGIVSADLPTEFPVGYTLVREM